MRAWKYKGSSNTHDLWASGNDFLDLRVFSAKFEQSSSSSSLRRAHTSDGL